MSSPAASQPAAPGRLKVLTAVRRVALPGSNTPLFSRLVEPTPVVPRLNTVA
jgi:hypothetical protein